MKLYELISALTTSGSISVQELTNGQKTFYMNFERYTDCLFWTAKNKEYRNRKVRDICPIARDDGTVHTYIVIESK